MKIALIGCGGLGTSLALGLLRSKDRDIDLRVCDRNKSKLAAIVNEFPNRQVITTASPREAAEGAEVVIIAVKPKDVFRTAAQIRDELDAKMLLVSCAAGISIDMLTQAVGKNIPIARAMPNTAISVAAGTMGVFLGPHCEMKRDDERLHRIFGVLGSVRTVHAEDLFHAVTALSGSGPAFVLLFLETLIDAGVRAGLARSEADFFAKGALRAAAALVDSGVLPPADLRAQITSPAGVTAEGLYQLERLSFRPAIMEAIDAACKRSKEITNTEQSS